MEHREHVVEEQNCVCPLSPRLQTRRVPCQRRFSFPSDLPAATKWPWDSTFALQKSSQFWRIMKANCCELSVPIRIICGKRGRRPQNLVHAPYRWASWTMPPWCFELISHYDRRLEKNMRKNPNWETCRSWTWNGRQEPPKSSVLYFQRRLRMFGCRNGNGPSWVLGGTSNRGSPRHYMGRGRPS